MTFVSVAEIKSRLAGYETRWNELEQKSRLAGGLVRHETWRRAYLENPYLVGAPADRIASRFRDIYINQAELGPSGKIGMLPIQNGGDSFMQKFTHMLEEYGSRFGGPTDDVIRAATEPLHKYFEHGDPIAMRIFENYTPPTEPYLVKYGKRKYLEPMLTKGETRICPASYYNDTSHNSAVRDDETSRYFYIPTFRERLAGKDSVTIQGKRLTFGDDDIVIPVVVRDYFLFSLCSSIYYRMPTDFDADSALIIRDPTRFKRKFIDAFQVKRPGWSPLYGPVTYYDPYRDYRSFTVPEMAKHFGYAYQREVRIAFKPKKQVAVALQHEDLCIGPMTDYAELLTAC